MLSTVHLAENIPIDKFLEVLGRYPATIKLVSDSKGKSKKAPSSGASKKTVATENDSLVQLDEWKNDIYKRVKERANSKGSKPGVYLTKPELQKIVQWKLKRGVFRPTLPALVASNTDETVESAIQTLFKSFPPEDDPVTCDKSKEKDDDAKIKTMLETVTGPLKGVGSATGTAILSAVFPTTMPFFSDEAFRWIMWSSSSAPAKKGSGWDRKIDYTLKEYIQICHGVWEVVERLRDEAAKQKLEDISIGAQEVERVGWTLGQQYKLGVARKSAEDAAIEKKLATSKAENTLSDDSITKKEIAPSKVVEKVPSLAEKVKPHKSKLPHTEETPKETEESSGLRRSKRTKR